MAVIRSWGCDSDCARFSDHADSQLDYEKSMSTPDELRRVVGRGSRCRRCGRRCGPRRRQMVCDHDRKSSSSRNRRSRSASCLIRVGEKNSGHGARRRFRLRRRMRSGTRRNRALARANEPDQGNPFCRCDRHRGTGCDHRRTAGEGARTKTVLSAGSGELKDCSIGGNVATNAGGPRCLKYGVTRNYVIGLEVVLANGEVLRTGGRVHKNKTGFDLIGLFVGSEGMLGVVTEITVRLLPFPPARATLSAAFATHVEAAATVQEIFAAGFLPSSLEIADRFTLEAARHDPGVADGARRETRICWSRWMVSRKRCEARRRSYERLVARRNPNCAARWRQPRRNAKGFGRCAASSAIHCAPPA